ncbi:anterior gradient 1 [Tachysurus fulvidraco]|uniref:anterior gradient 1 n=1 Tax=Tachysurus fulvidraco TaxID=1234273 RepID=UPI000F4DC419|nr:anterior gradient 1 [Tachysurus fulvidraco]
MASWSLYVFLLLLSCDVAFLKKKKTEKKENILARGWGDDITWVETYEEGLNMMKESDKPLMVIHHLLECPYSKALKKAFAENKSIQKMAKEDFIMLNVVEETRDPNMAPDGYYVPRILFVDPSMTVRADIAGKYNNRKFAYEPEDMDFLEKNMEKAKKPYHTEL